MIGVFFGGAGGGAGRGGDGKRLMHLLHKSSAAP